MDPEFYELLSSTVTIERLTGADSFGNNTYDAGTAVQCYIDQDQESMTSRLQDAGGSLSGSSAEALAYIDYYDPPFQEGDRVTLPGNRSMRVVTQRVYYDERGPYHQVLTMANNQER